MEPQWLNDTAFVWADSNHTVRVRDCRAAAARVLLDFGATFLGNAFTGVQASPDGGLLLVEMDSARVWRHSRRSTFVVYSPATGARLALGRARNVAAAVWRPAPAVSKDKDEDREDAVAFVEDGDLYVATIARVPQLALRSVVRVTADGSETVLNGVSGWLYEEEVLPGGAVPLWWAPDGRYLAWLRSDESGVTPYAFPTYARDRAYPDARTLRYPKPGTPNPVVALRVYDVAHNTTREVPALSQDDHYITYVTWVPALGGNARGVNDAKAATTGATRGETTNARDTILDNENKNTEHDKTKDTEDKEKAKEEDEDIPTILVKWTPRAQNIEHTVRVRPDTGAVAELYFRGHSCWVATHPVTVLGATGLFVAMEPNDDMLQLALYRVADGAFVRWLTGDAFPVVAVVGHDPATHTLFYQAAPTPITRHIFSVSLRDVVVTNNKNNQNNSQSIQSTNSTREQLTAPERGSWWSASASTGASWLVLTNGGPKVPAQALLAVRANNTLAPLETNAALRARLAAYDLPTVSHITVPAADPSVLLHGYVLSPPRSARRPGPRGASPALLHVYGGPGSQTVTTAWYGDLFHLHLASAGYVVFGVDGRGTGHRSESFMKQVYGRVGVLETEDALAAARHLRAQSGARRLGRMGVWGWSFGGFVAARALAHPNHSAVLACGVAVAPPVDWRYYDSAYAERYMGAPAANAAGYDAASVLPGAGNVRPHTLLLVHGTADDNVHFMNSALLSDALVEHGIPFETMYYANRDHAINTGNARRHLYRLIKRFLDRKLMPETFVENPEL